MQQEEAVSYIGKKVKILLTNNFHYSGVVLDVSEVSLILNDKFDNRVVLRLEMISVLEGQND